MRIILKSKSTERRLGDCISDHSLTVEEALRLCGYKRFEGIQMDAPDYIHEDDKTEIWLDDVIMEY